MQLVLLSGGSGKRLWPLSNESYSKQFLRILPAPDGTRESMVQRVVRQLRETGLDANVTIATGESQRDPICSQLGNAVHIVTEPERRDTFPAIALSCLYLEKEQQCGRDEVIVVMPSDPYTDNGYFHTIGQMAEVVKQGKGDLVLMGIRPLYPSTKYGYIVPEYTDNASVKPVLRFTEKPDEEKARELIDGGALWNGGVFAFRLGYMLDIIQRYVKAESFSEARSRYAELPKSVLTMKWQKKPALFPLSRLMDCGKTWAPGMPCRKSWVAEWSEKAYWMRHPEIPILSINWILPASVWGRRT